MKPGMPATLYSVLCLVAAGIPLLPNSGLSSATTLEGGFPGWPKQFEGRPLREEPMLPREKRFYRSFSGRIGKFTDGNRQVVIRWVPANSREFHLTVRCWKAIGYSIEPLPLHIDESGKHWGAFNARRGSEELVVHERIVEALGDRSWTDESAWRWHAFTRRTAGPWWAYTTAEKKN